MQIKIHVLVKVFLGVSQPYRPEAPHFLGDAIPEPRMVHLVTSIRSPSLSVQCWTQVINIPDDRVVEMDESDMVSKLLFCLYVIILDHNRRVTPANVYL